MATSALGRSKSFTKKNCIWTTICRRGLGNEPEEREQSGQKGIHRSAWRGPEAPAEPLAPQAGWMQRPNAARGHRGGSPAQTCFGIHSGNKKYRGGHPRPRAQTHFESQRPSPPPTAAGPVRRRAGARCSPGRPRGRAAAAGAVPSGRAGTSGGWATAEPCVPPTGAAA